MTISSSSRKAGPFTGNGSQTSFPFTFKAFTRSDVKAVFTDAASLNTTLVLDGDYSVTLNGDQDNNPGGTVTYPLSGAPLDSNSRLTITTSIPYTQPAAITNAGGFYPKVVETAFDRVTVQIQQLAEALGRSLTLPISTPNGVGTELPLPSASSLIGWDSAAQKLSNYDPQTLATVVSFGTSNGDLLSGDGVTVTFPLSNDPGALNNLDVAIGGVVQRAGLDYTWPGGTAIQFTNPPPSGTHNIFIRYMQGLPQSQAALPNMSGQDGRVLTNASGVPLWTSLLAALVGFTQSGTGAVARTVDAELKERFKSSQFGCVGNGVADDYAALVAAIAAVPDGSVLFIKGAVRIASPLVITRRVSLWCESPTDYILPDVGTSNDAITYQGNASGINGLLSNLHVYGRASACRNAIVLSRVDRSRIFMNVHCGASQYALVLDGCLINRLHLESTVNYAPPITSPAMQVDHILIQKNTTYTVASNANHLYVNLEGARNGITGTAQVSEGYNTIEGEIEGLSGYPLNVTTWRSLNLRNLSMEANSVAATFTNCPGLQIGPNVLNYTPGPAMINITGCIGYTVDGYYGSLNIDSTSQFGKLGLIESPDISSSTCNDLTAECALPLLNSTLPNQPSNTPGSSAIENVWHNPYFDIWATNAPASGPPDGCAVVAGIANRVTSPAYPGNPTGYAVRVTGSGTLITNGMQSTMSFAPSKEDGWMSVMTPVYVATGQPGVAVYLYNGSSYQLIAQVTGVKDTWVVVRGSGKIIAGNTIQVVFASINGSGSLVSGQFYVGGMSVVYGTLPPKHLCDHGRRQQYVVTSISNPPAYVGQKAVVAGVLYMAIATGASTDWKQIS